jgi:hypothetical protein
MTVKYPTTLSFKILSGRGHEDGPKDSKLKISSFHSLSCRRGIHFLVAAAHDRRISLSLKTSFYLPHMEYEGSFDLATGKMIFFCLFSLFRTFYD